MITHFKSINELDSFEELNKFIENNKKGVKNFRYYNNRGFDVVLQHKVTKLYYDIDNNWVGYGHLDFESKLWLGIIVADKYTGLGYGDFIMDDLLKNQNEDVYLTVDKNNKRAISLYNKKKFSIVEENDNYFLMIKKK